MSCLLICVFCVICGQTPDFSAVDQAVTAAVGRGDCPGAVVLIVHQDEVVYRKAFGHRAVQPDKVPMTADTVFDLASLTKPVATGTAVMHLIERGELAIDDPVSQHWPAFAANGKDKVTVGHLLLHTSGLTADNPLADYADGRPKALERIAGLKLEAPAGTRFRYSDVGFIVLGELVERVGGRPLDEYAREHVFKPLGMTDTGFQPAGDVLKRAAPTGRREEKSIAGVVHDPRAFRLGGVAGHAGLFGTADDLGKYCRMLLRAGDLDGVRVLAAESVGRFTEPREVPAPPAKGGMRKLYRSYGWDVDTPYTAQRGELFAAADGYGHTGFTGTSVWLDVPSRTAVIILTSRLHPLDGGNVVRLRREVGTAVAKAVGGR